MLFTTADKYWLLELQCNVVTLQAGLSSACWFMGLFYAC